MKNKTGIELGFGRFVIGPGERVNDADLPEDAREWFQRHGCEPDCKEPVTAEIEILTETPVLEISEPDTTEETEDDEKPKKRRTYKRKR